MRRRLSVRGALFADVTLRRLLIIPDIMLLGRFKSLFKGVWGLQANHEGVFCLDDLTVKDISSNSGVASVSGLLF